jgi:Flp pilus assembly protein TadD
MTILLKTLIHQHPNRTLTNCPFSWAIVQKRYSLLLLLVILQYTAVTCCNVVSFVPQKPICSKKTLLLQLLQNKTGAQQRPTHHPKPMQHPLRSNLTLTKQTRVQYDGNKTLLTKDYLMHKRIFLFTLVLLLMLSIALVSLTPMTVAAIGEVTPTPEPLIMPTAPAETEIDVVQTLTDGFLAMQDENLDEAVTLFTSVIQAEPDNAEAYLLRALANAGLEQTQAAIDDVTTAIGLVPETYHSDRAVVYPLTEWFLYTLRGNAYQSIGENALAMADYDAALRLSPSSDNDLTFASRAELNNLLGDTEAAEVDELVGQGMAALQAGNLEAGREFLTQATDTSQRTQSVAIAYYNLALINQAEENTAEAIQDYSEAIAISPNMHNAYLARGIAYVEAGDIAAAGSDFYNRMTILGTEFVDETLAIGSGIEIAMDYQRVVRITFEGTAGATITLSAREVVPGETDPLLVLLDPNGNPIAGDDDSGGDLDALIEDFELPMGGTYTLWVSHAEGGYIAGFDGIIRVAIEDCGTSGGCI